MDFMLKLIDFMLKLMDFTLTMMDFHAETDGFYPRAGLHRSAAPSHMYVTLVQTDGLGLGAWNKPGRGALPYSWEVTLPDLEIQPALLAMFYQQATRNDSFVAALSGPGYIYPKSAGAQCVLNTKTMILQYKMNDSCLENDVF